MKAVQVFTHQQDHLTEVALQTHMHLSSLVSITDWIKHRILFLSNPVSPLPHSWTQTKGKTQWHRPNCNPLKLVRASQLSEQVSSSALHWTLSERRLFPSTHRSLVNWVLEASQQEFGLGSSLEHRVNSNTKTKWIDLEKDVRGQTWLKFSPCGNHYWFLCQEVFQCMAVSYKPLQYNWILQYVTLETELFNADNPHNN